MPYEYTSCDRAVLTGDKANVREHDVAGAGRIIRRDTARLRSGCLVVKIPP